MIDFERDSLHKTPEIKDAVNGRISWGKTLGLINKPNPHVIPAHTAGIRNLP